MKQKTAIYKTPEEKELRKKYLSALNRCIFFEDYQDLATKFKADLSVFLKKRRYYRCAMFLLFTTLTFAQEGIVVGSGSLSKGSFVIGGNIIDTPMLNDNKFTKPQPKPKPRRKYRKSEKQRLKEALRKLTIKTKKR